MKERMAIAIALAARVVALWLSTSDRQAAMTSGVRKRERASLAGPLRSQPARGPRGPQAREARAACPTSRTRRSCGPQGVQGIQGQPRAIS